MYRGGVRLFSTLTARTASTEAAARILAGQTNRHLSTFLVRAPILGSRNRSTLALGGEKEQQREENVQTTGAAAAGGSGNKDEKRIVSYWGVEAPKVNKDDGSEWKWSCFRVYAHELLLLISFLGSLFYVCFKQIIDVSVVFVFILL